MATSPPRGRMTAYNPKAPSPCSTETPTAACAPASFGQLAKEDLDELLRQPVQLRRARERVFEDLRAALDTAREMRQGRQTMEAVARYFPERLATVRELLDELAREDEATARAREPTRAER